MAVLIDTSVWIEHFKNRNDRLIQLLNQDLILIHPFILAEIACGPPPPCRLRTLSDLDLLPQSHPVDMTEIMRFIETEKLYGLGFGLVDITLLASTMKTPDAKLWSLDKRLEKLAKRHNVSYQPTH